MTTDKVWYKIANSLVIGERLIFLDIVFVFIIIFILSDT